MFGTGPSGTSPGPPSTSRRSAVGLTGEEALGIVESLPDAVVVLGPAGIVHYGNDAATTLFGYSFETLVGRAFEDLVSSTPTDHRRQPTDATEGGPGTSSWERGPELVARCSNGSELPVEVHLVPLVPLGRPGEPTAVLVVRPVTGPTDDETARSSLLAADRERVASELGGHVVRRLFQAGMALQSVARLVDETVREHLELAVEELDAIVRDIRAVAVGEPVARTVEAAADRGSTDEAAEIGSSDPGPARSSE